MNELLHQLRSLIIAKTDYTELLKWARRVEKQGLVLEDAPSLKVAVLGSKNSQFFTQILKVSLMNQGIQPNIYEGEYDSIRYELLTQDSGLHRFKPDFLILLPDSSDLKIWPQILDDELTVDTLVETHVQDQLALWNSILQDHPCVILQSNYVLPLENALDSMEINVPYSKTVFLTKLNLALMKAKPKQVHLIDENGLSNEIGKRAWFDPANRVLNKAPYAYEWLPQCVSIYVRQIMALKGTYRKVLVLDLDNTLWGGVIGDDGLEGIQLDPNTAIGESFLAFQSAVLSLKEKGVMLAVCSKNDQSIAQTGFSHPNMTLKISDIACFIANWNDKASNLKTIAETLNVKPDALVFFDDNPAERQIVKDFLSEVLVVEVPEDPSGYVRALYDAHAFDWPQITKEDLMRIKAVEGDSIRESLKAQFVDYDAYLASLQMSAIMGKITPAQLERFVQLTNKSNQFNLRTQRVNEAEILDRMNDPESACLAIDLSDRFSPYGIIACAILKKQGQTAFIENWIMSCRVLNRGVEKLTLSLLAQTAKHWGCTTLIGENLRSPKNDLVADHYLKMGFTQVDETKYALDLSIPILPPDTITLKETL